MKPEFASLNGRSAQFAGRWRRNVFVGKALGPARYVRDSKLKISQPGVVTGLAYTPYGGEVLHIEAARYAGKGNDAHRTNRKRDERIGASSAQPGSQPEWSDRDEAGGFQGYGHSRFRFVR